MKKEFLLFICFFIVTFADAETEYSLRKYYQDNILNLDPIEGIYNVEMGFIQYSPFHSLPKKDTFNDDIAIVKRPDGSYHIYSIETMNEPKFSHISKINDGIYSFNYNLFFSFNQRFTLQNEIMFSITYELSKSQQDRVCDRSKGAGSAVRMYFVYNAIKSYPTSSMYLEAAKEDAKKAELELQKALEEAQAKAGWSGTGFALNSGHVVTNYHVIDGAKDIVVKGVKGDFTTAYHADVVASDKTNDLAILKINDSAFKGFGAVPYRIRSSMVDVGAYVWTLGYPMTAVMGDEIKYTDGKINSKSGIQGDLSVYQVSIPIQPGNSGSPVFDKSGYVVGIASSGLNREVFNSENVNYAIKSSYLRMLVESTLSSNIFPNGTALQGISNTEQIKIAKNFVYMIQCTNLFTQDSSLTNNSSDSGLDATTSNRGTIFAPSVRSTTAHTNITLEYIVITENYTLVKIALKNDPAYGWCNISPNTYIEVGGIHYTMTKADGIAIAPEKTYFSKIGEMLYFRLYFPAIPKDATKIDLIEPGDNWKWYGIDISGK